MSHSISSAEANRQFSAVLRAVRAGEEYVVTSHGRPVARILPFREGADVTQEARATLLARLRSAPVQTVGRWTRDELYDDEA